MNIDQGIGPALAHELRALHLPAGRRLAGRFLVEGRRAIDGFLAAGWVPTLLAVRDGETIPEGWTGVRRLTQRIADRVSQSSTTSGFIGCFPIPTASPLDGAAGGLVLAGIADPGNLGTLLRTAAACAWPQVLLVGGADPYGHKAVQASSGALARVRLDTVDGDRAARELPRLFQGAAGCALVVQGGLEPHQLPPGRRWLVIGNEAHGLDESLLARCQERLTLPMPGGVDSLNAAVAGSIACYLLSRGQHGAPRSGA